MRIVIGNNGIHPCGAWSLLFDVNGISFRANATSFNICGDLLFDVNLYLFKDTEEGRGLIALFSEQASREAIVSYLDSLILKHVSPDEIRSVITNIKEKAFADGQQHKAKEILQVLGL